MCSCKCMVLAGLGGTMPTVCRLAATYVTNPETPLPQWGLCFGLGLFFIIGVVLAYAFTENDLRKAFILGIAAPGIITNIMAGASQPGRAVAKNISPPAIHGTKGFIPSVYAGEKDKNATEKQPDENKPPEKTIQTFIHFRPNIQSYQVAETEVQVSAVLKSGKEVALGSYPPYPTLVATSFIPPNTTYILFRAKDIVAKQEIPRNVTGPLDINVKLSFRPKNDFLWALGYRREMDITGIQPVLK